MKKESLMAFNDGVLAIIVTLMVFNIKLSTLNAAGFRELAVHIGIYAISFLFVAIYWQNLHAMLDAVRCVTSFAVWMNLLLLFVLSLIPLPTQAVGEHPKAVASHVFFGVVMTAAAIAYAALHKAVEDDLPVSSDEIRRQLRRKNTLSTVVLLVSPLLAMISIWLSLVIFIAIPIAWIRPSKHLAKPD